MRKEKIKSIGLVVPVYEDYLFFVVYRRLYKMKADIKLFSSRNIKEQVDLSKPFSECINEMDKKLA